MDERNDSLAAAVRRWAEHARPQAGEHPAYERLAAYAGDRLGEADVEGLRDHLALCRACSRLVLDLRAFPDLVPPPGVAAPSPEEIDREWRRLWNRVGAESQRTGGSRPWVPWALAAGLFITTLGAAGWIAVLQRRLREQVLPRTDIAFVERVVTGGGTRAVDEAVAGAAAPLILTVDAPVPRDTASFRWEILRSAGGAEPLWRGAAARRPDGRFVLQLPPGFLAPGNYRLRLSGSGPGGRLVLAEVGLRLGP